MQGSIGVVPRMGICPKTLKGHPQEPCYLIMTLSVYPPLDRYPLSKYTSVPLSKSFAGCCTAQLGQVASRPQSFMTELMMASAPLLPHHFRDGFDFLPPHQQLFLHEFLHDWHGTKLTLQPRGTVIMKEPPEKLHNM